MPLLLKSFDFLLHVEHLAGKQIMHIVGFSVS